MTDPTVLEALESAVAAAPDNDSLRFYLCDLLIAAGKPSRALQLCAELLNRKPDHAEAIAKVAQASIALRPAEAKESLAEVVHLKAVSRDDDIEATTSDVKLADVAGMDEVKRRLNLAFLAPMRNPEVRRMYGKSLRGGLLLYGPPGCGKTFIARAAAGELGARFVSIGLADVLEMWFGQSERNLHEIFETARRNRPCVLFFDEIDALGRKRSLMRESAGRD